MATVADPDLVRLPPKRGDRIGRVLMAVDAVLTLGALADGFTRVAASDDAHLLTEMWRTLAYIVFAGIWAILAVQPRRQWGLWELLLAQKLAITLFALVNLSVEGAVRHAVVDGWLVISTVLAYVLCRGWWAWRGFSPAGPRP